MSDYNEKVYKTCHVTQEKPAKLQSTVSPVTGDGTQLQYKNYTRYREQKDW